VSSVRRPRSRGYLDDDDPLLYSQGLPHRDEHSNHLKGEEFEAIDRSIDVHVSKLRQKLGDSLREPELIKTIRGVGYLLAAEGDRP
jgi:DNA-binding response OmpR family regulator